MTRPQPRTGRLCSRVGCRHLATQTLTYIYADSTAVLGPLATFSEPHAYDLCDQHSLRMSAPVGWTVIKHEPESVASGPTNDDLMAIADAVREAGSKESSSESVLIAQIRVFFGTIIFFLNANSTNYRKFYPDSYLRIFFSDLRFLCNAVKSARRKISFAF